MARPSSSKNDDSTDELNEEQFIDGFKNLNDFTKSSFQSVMQAIKSANNLPSSGDDFDYYSSFDSFRNLMDMEGSRVLHIIQNIMRYHGARGNVSAGSKDTEDRFDVLVDANDQLLERVGTFLDEATGLRKKEAPLVVATATVKSNKPISGSWNRKTPPAKGPSARTNFRLLAAKNISRPQLKFRDKIDNTTRPFVPKLKVKPNALKPLTESLEIDRSMGELEDWYTFPHPYQYELDQWKPDSTQLQKRAIQEAAPYTSLPAVISSESDLDLLLTSLRGQTEIAVDLEHHSYRSFQGFTCLMQLSTRTQDFIVDTIALRHELHVLNQVFTDPTVVKVFHGADMDIEWLQRDLGLYIVNMFDTGQAARVLQLQRFSLAHLLHSYCGVEANKQFQMADWRIRPLPEELLEYAREDTHYLLYIYDRLRHELIDRGNNQNNLLHTVIHRSNTLCGKTYKKPGSDHDGHMTVYKRTKKTFNSQQLDALRGLYEWRDGIARREDESTGYVLPNHMLMQICEVLPREPQGILACCNPIPPLVRQNLTDLHTIVKVARETPLVKVVTAPRRLEPSRTQHPKYDVTSLLHCPHDMSHPLNMSQEGSQDVTTNVTVPQAKKSQMFQRESNVHVCSIQVKASPILTALGYTHNKHQKLTEAKRKAARIKKAFVNPLEKFLPMEILQKIHKNHENESLGLIAERWKLLPHTTKPDVVLQTGSRIPLEKTLESGDVILCDLEEPEISLSLRQQKSKKPKKRDSDGTSESQAKRPRDDPDHKVMQGSKVPDGKPKKKKVPTATLR